MSPDAGEILLTAAIGGAGFRFRGAEAFSRITGRGATTARVVCWAAPVAALAWALAALPWQWAVALGAALWLGCLPGWWGSLDLGRDEGIWATDALAHAARGLLWTAPAAFVLAALEVDGGDLRRAVDELAAAEDPARLAPLLAGLSRALADAARVALSSSGAWLALGAGLAVLPAYEIGWRVAPERATEIGEALFGAAAAAAIIAGAALAVA
jgi:hypothetical protein